MRLRERTGLSPEERAAFEERGLLVIEDALDPELVARLVKVQDRIYGEERLAGRLGPDGSLHLLGFLGRDPLHLELLDWPATFSAVWSILGWNIHMYHCHLDVHPPIPGPSEPRWGWHQDGGRQNLEVEGERPRLSVKVAFFLSDVSVPGRGNFMVIPGSHRRNTLPRPEETLGFDPPPGAEPVLARPGTAVIFDRRLWHSRSDNLSAMTRKALFLGYTFRWIRPRDRLGLDPSDLPPVRRQLLGWSTGEIGHWIPTDEDVPLRAELLGASLRP